MKSINDLYQNALDPLLREAEIKALDVFHQASQRVPAYKMFLSEMGVNPEAVKTIEDFKKLPIISKENYLRKYSAADLMWDGKQFSGDLISVSSGSSGEPYFWLRDQAQHNEAADIYIDLYKNAFDCANVPTLLVVCFSMGIWIAGSYTTLGAMAANAKGLKLNIITPAIEISDDITVIKKLQNNYDQIILAGYPPFLKDLIDKGKEEGIDWPNLNIGFTAAGESISEELREYFLQHGTRHKDPTKVINIYGTVDTGILGHETPLSILLRRQIYHNGVQEKLFGSSVLPTLVQYDPRKKFIEFNDGNIVFTTSTGMPLVRYDIKDTGGGVSELELAHLLDNEESLQQELEAHKIDVNIWAKPFIYVHGRADLTASLYAVLIYPENIKKALFNERVVNYSTGRFVLSTENDQNLDQYLEILIELKGGIAPSPEVEASLKSVIIETLELENSEYRRLREAIGPRSDPSIVLLPSDHQRFSRTTNKQKWTNKAKENQ